MSVVWGAVADHQGYIDFDSAGDQGATFTLYFPITRETLPEEVHQPGSLIHGSGEKVMVVDDVADQGRIACEVLTALGYDAVAVSSGEEALAKLRDTPFDLVVLDMVMATGMDGLETFRRIRDEHPEQRAIIASGFAETDRVREAQRMGAGSYVRKPYTIRSLGEAVQKELSKITA
jgi:CheY-like chemotaxis protein